MDQAHLLVVEDDDDIREELAQALIGHGYEVAVADGAAQAQAEAARKAPDLLRDL